MHEIAKRLAKAHDLTHKTKLHKSVDAMHHPALESAKRHIKAVYNTFTNDKPNEVEEIGKAVGQASVLVPLIKSAHQLLLGVHDHAAKPPGDEPKGFLKSAMEHLTACMKELDANPGTAGANPGADGGANPGTGKRATLDHHLVQALGLMIAGKKASPGILASVREQLDVVAEAQVHEAIEEMVGAD